LELQRDIMASGGRAPESFHKIGWYFLIWVRLSGRIFPKFPFIASRSWRIGKAALIF